jgi:sugar O-acyltransferase (sialic acid O-acetyltransferase NeuD family)
MQELLLIGAGGHSKSCIDVIEKQGKYQIKGIIGQKKEVGNSILGYKIIGADDDLPSIRKSFDTAFITIGQIKTAANRIKIFILLKNLGFQVPTIFSPNAIISDHSEIGEGTIIHHNAIINADVKIGINCIINSGALVEHDCQIGNHCHIATRSILNGNVKVGNQTFIGSNSVMKNGITIGNQCIISMGSSIKKSIPDNSIIK